MARWQDPNNSAVVGGGAVLLGINAGSKAAAAIASLNILNAQKNAAALSGGIDSNGTTLLIKEIMESANPVPDVVLQSGLRWDASGTFRGSTGTWELVVDTSTNTVVYFNFVAQ